MAVKTKEEIMQMINERFSESTDDETLAFIEDVSDTFDDLQEKGKDTTDWEQKYKENDESWRKRYKERFFSGQTEDEPEEEPETVTVPTTFEELFTEQGVN